MSRKTTAGATSKVSAPPPSSTSTSTPTSTQKSSILRSSFAPSRFQLRLFASVIQSFDSQHLRIHDTNNSRLRCVHKAKPNAKITCLDWGRYPHSKPKSQSQNQRSPKSSQTPANENVVVAYGTSDSEICIFSPTESKLVATLVSAHERGVYDVKFSQHSNDELWSIGGDSSLVQWNLQSGNPTKTITLPDPAIRTLSSPSPASPQLICASSTPFALNLDAASNPQFDGLDSMRNPIHSLFRSDEDEVTPTEHLLASDEDRYLNIYDMSQKRLVRSLIATGGVVSADLLSSKSDGFDTWDTQMLAVVTANGLVELFSRPFVSPTSRNGDTSIKRKGLTQKSNAQVKLVSSTEKVGQSSVTAASLQGPDLFIASVDGGADVSFQKIRWQDEGTGELLFDSTKEIVRVRTGSSLNAASANGIKDVTNSHVDESQTVVINGIGNDDVQDAAAVELSSSGEDAEQEDEDDDEVEDSEDTKHDNDGQDDQEDEEMQDDRQNVDDDESHSGNDAVEGEEPSFGEMLASRTSQTIDIAETFAPEAAALAKVDNGQLSLPTGMSLGTVLTQALRSNDRNLLEACLHTTDLDVVRNTIQRLDSSLAGILLSKLAERISSRPGRYGDLQLWVQQLCVAHGAAISSQPAVLNQVKVLYRVLNERSKCLSPLLLLKGKLDMLNAQVEFRKQLAAQRATRQGKDGEPGMIYIEGEPDNWDSDEDYDEAAGSSVVKPSKHRKALEDLADEDEDDDDDMPLVNGIDSSDEDDENEDDDEPQLRAETLVDDEAADEEEEEEEEDSEEGGDVDSEEEEDDSEEEDSEMDSFINDGSVDVDGEEDELDAVDEDETPQKPAAKRSRHR